jgi:hypothetical protein
MRFEDTAVAQAHAARRAQLAAWGDRLAQLQATLDRDRDWLASMRVRTDALAAEAAAADARWSALEATLEADALEADALLAAYEADA